MSDKDLFSDDEIIDDYIDEELDADDDYDEDNEEIEDDDIDIDEIDILETKELPKEEFFTKKKEVKKEKNGQKQYSDPPLIQRNSILENSKKSMNIYIVADSDRITSNFLIREEISQLLSIRSTHIDKNGTPEYLASIVSKEKDKQINITAIDIAELELKHKLVPLKLQRYIGSDGKNEYYEIWDPNTMNIIEY